MHNYVVTLRDGTKLYPQTITSESPWHTLAFAGGVTAKIHTDNVQAMRAVSWHDAAVSDAMARVASAGQS